MSYKVTLKSVGNSDFRQDPTRPMYGVPTRTISVPTVAAAVAACREYIAEHRLGFGNWVGGQIRQNKALVGQVLYKGRAVTASSYAAFLKRSGVGDSPLVDLVDEEVSQAPA
jgi:hypothetical protein